MPRSGAGGKVGNRSDLLTPKVPTTVTAPDQEYGKRTSQEQSMRILPVGTPDVATPPTGGSPAANAALGGGQPGPTPGSLPWLEPTTHGQPVTSGRPYGAGAGPEALTGPAAQWHAAQATEQGTLQSLLGGMAARPGASSVVKGLAAAAGAG